MTTIEKLSIQGIRSYSPNVQQIIEFEKPLTIIVGENGSGKTTVIECLKYATTGDYPPNSSSGQAFVHDPKLEGEGSVKATVRLRFTTASGKPVTATRVLELKQKPNNKQECHLLSAALSSIGDDGQPVSHTLKCADIGLEVPQLMGVSKAILDNVIFCHQEESNWPMQDGKKLKAKFDEIFSATRYTRALEELRKQRKSIADTVRVESLKLDTLRVQRDHVHRLAADTNELQAKNDATVQRQTELRDSLAADQEQLAALRAALDADRRRADKLRAVRERVAVLRSALASADELLARHAAASDADVEAALARCIDDDRSQQQQQRRLAAKQADVSAANADRQQLEQQRADLSLSLGQCQAELDRRRQLHTSRAQLVRDMAASLLAIDQHHDLDNHCNDDDDGSDRLLRLVDEKLASIERNVDALIDAQRQQAKHFESLLDDAKASVTSLEGTIARNDTERLRHVQALAGAELAIARQQELRGGLDACEQQLARAVQQLAELQAAGTDEQLGGQLAELQARQAGIDRAIADNMAQFEALQKRKEKVFHLASLQSQVEQYAQQTQQLVASHPKLLQSLDRNAQSARQALADAQQRLRDADAQLQRAQAAQRSADTDSAGLAGQVTAARNHLADLEQRADAARLALAQLVEQSSPIEAFPAACASAAEDVRRARDELSQTKSTQDLYRVFIAQARETHDCPLCGVEFNSADRLAQFVTRLEDFLSAVDTDDVGRTARTLQAAVQRHERLKQAEPSYHELRQLDEQEIPRARLALAELQQRADAARDELARCQTAVRSVHQPAVDAARQHVDVAQRFAELTAALATAQDSVALRAAELKAADGERTVDDSSHINNNNNNDDDDDDDVDTLAGVDRVIERVSLQYEQLRDSRRQTEAAADRLREAQQAHRQRLHEAQMERSRLDADVLEARRASELLQEARQQKQRAQDELDKLAAHSASVQPQLEAARNRLAELGEERRQAEAAAAERLRDGQRQRDAAGSKRAAVRVVDEQLAQQRTRRALDEQLAQARAQLARIEDTALPEADARIRRADDELRQLQDSVSGQQNGRRELEDVLRYRGRQRELTAAEAELAQLETTAGSSEATPATVERVARAIDVKKEKLHNLEGRRHEYVQRVRRNERELQLPENQAVVEQYRRQLIALKTYQLAGDDLERYQEALDKALMKYHSIKMQEINKIIKQLWQSTYQGKDIDTIEIRAELPASAAAASSTSVAAGPRAARYSYRVVMLQGDTELDMSGRCSAGQKVLGSIIIRLALAETFCLSCGILALDEPTTNLDRRNVEGLAAALSQIIASRRYQQNFQLLVITHDEEFVQLLGRADLANYYLRVSKNADHHSVIARRDIHDIA